MKPKLLKLQMMNLSISRCSSTQIRKSTCIMPLKTPKDNGFPGIKNPASSKVDQPSLGLRCYQLTKISRTNKAGSSNRTISTSVCPTKEKLPLKVSSLFQKPGRTNQLDGISSVKNDFEIIFNYLLFKI